MCQDLCSIMKSKVRMSNPKAACRAGIAAPRKITFYLNFILFLTTNQQKLSETFRYSDLHIKQLPDIVSNFVR